jgi:hypothetical protein
MALSLIVSTMSALRAWLKAVSPTRESIVTAGTLAIVFGATYLAAYFTRSELLLRGSDAATIVRTIGWVVLLKVIFFYSRGICHRPLRSIRFEDLSILVRATTTCVDPLEADPVRLISTIAPTASSAASTNHTTGRRPGMRILMLQPHCDRTGRMARPAPHRPTRSAHTAPMPDRTSAKGHQRRRRALPRPQPPTACGAVDMPAGPRARQPPAHGASTGRPATARST